MLKLKQFYSNLSKTNKVISFSIIALFALVLIITIPTLANYKYGNIMNVSNVWDGSIASHFKDGDGSSNSPYIISDGSELAFLAQESKNDSFSNTYFQISNNILLNEGILNYDEDDGITYILEDNKFYVKAFTSEYYDNQERSGESVGSINIFPSIEHFKGKLLGNGNAIYGLYITNEEDDNLGLFNNLDGEVSDLYLKNTLVNGGINTGGLASTTNKAILTNILVDGFVIGKTDSEELVFDLDVDDINVESNDTSNFIALDVEIPDSPIITNKISGSYEITGATSEELSLKINGVEVTDGNFEIDLGINILEEIEIISSTASFSPTTIKFNNVKYSVIVPTGSAGGVIGISENFTTMENVINKSTIFGYAKSGGLIASAKAGLNINQSYNTGSINSSFVTGGLISTVENIDGNINLTKIYNSFSDTLTGGLIGRIINNTGVITINNAFDNSLTNTIGAIKNTTVNITNTYHTNEIPLGEGIINGVFTITDDQTLQSSDLITLLDFKEYIDDDDYQNNQYNIWVFKEQAYPILIFDDDNNVYANIYVGNLVYNKFSMDLKKVSKQSNIVFTVETTDVLTPIKEKYFFVSDENIPLSKEQLHQIDSWEPLNQITTIENEGNYIIYVKIVDYWDRVTLINSDVLIIDETKPNITIDLDDDHIWHSFREELDSININHTRNIKVNVEDDLSDIESINYYISDEVKTFDEIENLDEEKWNLYDDKINLNKSGNYIIYIKAIDAAKNIAFSNTDILILDGYDSSLSIGVINYDYNSDANITDNSCITLDFNYISSNVVDNEGQHNLISNVLLPKNTILHLYDHIENKAYVYEIKTDEDDYNFENSCLEEDCTNYATYPLTLFKELGRNDEVNYLEQNYIDNGTIKEEFTLILDFSEIQFEETHLDINIYLELHNTDDEVVRTTLDKDNNSFTIHPNTSASINLTSDYQGEPIYINSDSINNINLTSSIAYPQIDDVLIIDTKYESKNFGIEIKIIDENDNIVKKDKLNTIQFTIDNETYHLDDDNKIRIKMHNSMNNLDLNLIIKTSEGNTKLADGNYYLKINTFISNDGYYPEAYSNQITIPVNVIPQSQEYSFTVNIDNPIINKVNEEQNLDFNIIQTGDLENPNIRVSLYKKAQLTGFNQDYVLVDLNKYVTNKLHRQIGYIYYVNTGDINLNFITEDLEYTSYKLVFELYDDAKLLGVIKKYLLVR